MQNLSHMTPNASLIGYSSMAGGNTLSDQTGSMTSPGSDSETTSYAAKSGTPDVQESGAAIPVGTPADRDVTKDTYSPASASWQMLPGNGFSKETP